MVAENNRLQQSTIDAQEKSNKLNDLFPGRQSELNPFLNICLENPFIRIADITNGFKFATKKTENERQAIASLVAFCFAQTDSEWKKVGRAGDGGENKRWRKEFIRRLEVIRQFTTKFPMQYWRIGQLRRAARALRCHPVQILEIVHIRSRILRGLRKHPRPYYGAIFPIIVGWFLTKSVITTWPNVSVIGLYLIYMTIVVSGTWVLSMYLSIAPGILYSGKLSRYLRRLMDKASKPEPSGIDQKMQSFKINVEEFARYEKYENQEAGTRIFIRDKRQLEGAVQMLTSAEEIGNCIALRHFVAWTLPSYLNDPSIMLADVYSRGAKRGFSQRGQIWMIASERAGQPVLVVNSVEFNNEGAKHTAVLMPEVIKVLQDVAHRAGFGEIYVGISEYGREWLDERFSQGEIKDPIRKIHSPSAGYRYHFDVFRHKWRLVNGRPQRVFEYVMQRPMVARLYALLFGALEHLQGRRAKAQAFFATAANVHNCWQIPLEKPDQTLAEPNNAN